MTRGLKQMARARVPLKRAAADEFAVTIRITDIWFDVNKDGKRQKGEAAAELFDALQPAPRREIRVLGGPGTEDQPAEEVPQFDGLIRFDSADADWLMAYTHLVSGFGELTLAADPTPSIRRVTEARDGLRAYGSLFFDSTGWADEEWVEMAAATLLTLRGKPDQTRTRAAHAHFREMIAYNRNFWEDVMTETDNEREWLPNPDQQSAFGMPVDANLAESWQSVLGEISAVLEGEALVPYWRVPNMGEREKGVGINLAKWLQGPGRYGSGALDPGRSGAAISGAWSHRRYQCHEPVPAANPRERSDVCGLVQLAHYAITCWQAMIGELNLADQ